MLPYWILFAIPAWMAISNSRQQPIVDPRWSQKWQFMYIALVLMVGLRDEIGVDWLNYVGIIDSTKGQSFYQILNTSEAGYNLFNWIAAQSGLGVYLVDMGCAILFAWGVVEFCLAQPRPWLALVVAVPYLIIAVAMGYSRQGVAIGIAMLGFVALGNLRYGRFLMFILFAASFHKSALILIPLAALANPRNKLWNFAWVSVLFIIIYSLFIKSSFDIYQTTYVDAGYQSVGANIRIIMNVVPALIFLLFRHRFDLHKVDQMFWTWISLVALALFVALQLSKSSTAVDRIGLYIIPLQLFVYSRIPEAFGDPKDKNIGIVVTVVLVNALVQFTWFFFAVHSRWWLPYKFFPLVWLKQ